MNPPTPTDSLSRTLRGWRLQPPRNPDFRPAVWRRISAAARPAGWTTYARAHVGAVAGALALAIAVGALAGREQARARVAFESTQLAAAYVQGLDARAMSMR